ncbi:MAG: hypothetical protein KGL39_51885 [Patescibacteria group bacterium]|nr:hypothetical protein [Patescibacteria group bacterium]
MSALRRAERYATRKCAGMGDPHWWALRNAYLAGLRADRKLLRWALAFVKDQTDALEECHKNRATGEIEPQEVAEEVAAARRWIEEAKGVLG